MKTIRSLSHIAAAAALAMAGSAYAGGDYHDKGTSAGKDTGQPATHGTMARDQAATAGHVPVDISAIKPEMGMKLEVNQARLPTVVAVPSDVAASACGVPENEVAKASGSGATACRAQDSTPELEAAIRQEFTRSSSTGR
jgi:hypothetical protein